jgi:hypothetical protein
MVRIDSLISHHGAHLLAEISKIGRRRLLFHRRTSDLRTSCTTNRMTSTAWFGCTLR